MTELRREAEALLRQLVLVRSRHLAANESDLIEAFAKAQRVKEVEAIEARAKAAPDAAEFFRWLSQRKKELEP